MTPRFGRPISTTPFAERNLHQAPLRGGPYIQGGFFGSSLSSLSGLCGLRNRDDIINMADIKAYFEHTETSFTAPAFEGAFHEMHHETKIYRVPYFEFLKDSLSVCP